MRQREQAQSDTSTEPWHILLAREAILADMSREQVIEGIIQQIRRDEGYLTYRKVAGRRSNCEEWVNAEAPALLPDKSGLPPCA